MAGRASRVSTVATIRPPMMATAIGPQNTRARQRDHGQHGRGGRQHDRAQAAHGRLDDRVPGRHAARRGPARSGRSGSPSCAGSCPSAQSRPSSATKPNGRFSSSSAAATPAMPSGPVRNTSMARLKLCSCSISSVKVMNSMIGMPAAIEAEPLAAFLHRAGHLDAVVALTCRCPLGLQCLELRQQFGGHGRALQAFDDVALHGDGVVAVLAPHHAGLPGERRLGDLRQRNRLARWPSAGRRCQCR